MDRNTIIGLLLIGLILIGFQYYNTSQIEKNFEKNIVEADSLFKAEDYLKARDLYKKAANYQPTAAHPKNQLIKIAQILGETEVKEVEKPQQNATLQEEGNKAPMDSLFTEKSKQTYGAFAENASGNESFYVLENSKIKLTLTNKGAKPAKVELSEFKTYFQEDLYLLTGNGDAFTLNFFMQNRPISTEDLYFEAVETQDSAFAGEKAQKAVFRLYADSSSFVEFIYTLEPDNYVVDFDIKFVGMQNYIPKSTNYLDLYWSVNAPRHERGRQWEAQNTTIYYQILDAEVDKLTEASDEEEEDLTSSTKWISFKQQFFSSVMLADQYFESAKIKFTDYEEDNNEFLTQFSAELSIPVDFKQETSLGFKFYYGPNKFSTLNEYNEIIASKEDKVQLQQMVPLGWSLFRWINRFVIIPLFDFLGQYMANYGLIILVMTFVIKMVLFPFTYKSYLSSARMRVLKPEIEAINAKIPKDKAMERQQATMALYKKAGVNPMGGCLPMLFQFPILIALYLFFPASIELRQKSFLWADDLSTYDSILQLPFNIPMYGDHVSLFTLLMALAMLGSTMMNTAQMGDTNQMPGMKTVMYLMPVMMVVWFNNYSAGLSWYYFLSSVITIGQTYAIRYFIDDNAILAKIKENKKKPVKKSRFQERLEAMQKQQVQNTKRK